MIADEDVEAPRIDKGKGRAVSLHPTESTPLLGSRSNSHEEPEDHPTPQQHLWSKLFTVFTITLLTCVFILLVLLLIAYSYGSRASGISSDILIKRALVLRGPDRIDVLNFTQEDGLWVQVDGRIGANAGAALEINSEEDDGLLAGMWKSLGQWGIRKLDSVTVNLSTIHVSTEYDSLANISFPPIDVPLTTNPPENLAWLQKFSLPIHIKPTNDSSALLRFVKDTWKEGMVNVRAVVDEATISGGHLNENSWRKRLHLERSDITSSVRLRIPHLPGLPPPGHEIPFSDLVSLRWFLIRSTSDRLIINATASVVNPLPDSIGADLPVLPFTILLPAQDNLPVPIANVSTFPFSLTHPNMTLSISGHVLPISKSSSPYLSSFLSSYLSAVDAPILISSPLVQGLSVPALFPAPRPPPQVLRNVTIKDMKIKPTNSGNMAASGTVFARVVLPHGINVGLDVTKVFPDVLIFDGPVSGSEDDDDGDNKDDSEDKALYRKASLFAGIGSPPERPLPDPLPERAFAHIRPEDWLPSISTPMKSEDGEGSVVEVTAKIVDVPLEVLPGRDKEFRSFVGKVIFGSNGALAGVQGVAAVAVHVRGLPIESGSGGEMELEGLPFQGSVRIGKKAL